MVGSKERPYSSKAFSLPRHSHKHPHLLHTEVVLQGVLQLSSSCLLRTPLQILHLRLDLWQRAAQPSGHAQTCPWSCCAPTTHRTGQCESKPPGRREAGERGNRTHKAGRAEATDRKQADSLLLLGLLLATAAPDDANDEEEEENSHCHSHSNECPFGYWCNVQGAEMNRRVKPKQNQSGFKPLPGTSVLRICTFRITPIILDRAQQGGCSWRPFPKWAARMPSTPGPAWYLSAASPPQWTLLEKGIWRG